MKIVCLGANNPETIRVVSAIGNANSGFEFLGFVDNDKEKWGKFFYGYPIFGGMDKVAELSEQGALFCNLITRDCVTRHETTKSLIEAGAELANLIHPTVDLEMVNIGVGNYIQENVIVQAEVSIGDNSSIHMGSLIGHESRIGNSVFIAHGCAVSGFVTVGDGVFIGAGATVLPRVSIGKWSIIGAGAVVIQDVPEEHVYVSGRNVSQHSRHRQDFHEKTDLP